MLYNCVLTGNTARYGGGAAHNTLINCLITGNTGEFSGGGCYWSTLVNCTVTDNTSGNSSGGTRECILTNSIVYYNNAPVDPNHQGYYVSALYYSCTTPLPETGSNNITVEPLLASMSHLSAASPCRNTGNPTVVVGVDIDGEPWNNPPPMGCDEFGPVGGALTVAMTTTETNLSAGYVISLRAEISGKASSSYWDFGDGTILSNRPVAIHQWSAAGDYLVVLRAFNTDRPTGVSATSIVHVLNNPIHYVSLAGANPQSPYLTWATAATNIQDAVDAAYVGGTVIVSNGIYNVGSRVIATETNRLAVTRPLLIQSVGGAAATVISGGGQMRCVYLTNRAALTGFTLTNGYTAEYGGGISCASRGVGVTNYVIRGNASAYIGGGVNNGTMVNCLINGNSANTSGGGAYYSTLINCTVVGNAAISSYGGGTTSCDVYNSILYYNTSGLFPASYANDAFSVINYSCTTPLPSGSGNFITAPNFVNQAAGDFHLQSSSPCINAGTNSYAPAGFDFDGNPRILGGAVDVGAYEFVPPPPPPPLSSAAPFAFTGEATEIHTTQARLNGFATPNGTNTTAWFEWGPRGQFTAATTPANWTATFGVRHQSQTISNLLPQTTYQYRLVTSNVFGVVTGVTRYFSTGSHVTAWRHSLYGQLDLLGGLTNAVAIAAGYYHSLMLDADGNLATWGHFSANSPTNIPPNLTNVAAITAGDRQSLALLADRTVTAWGSYYDIVETLPASVPAGLTNVVAFSAYDHTIALHDCGTITMWGAHRLGQTNAPPGLSNIVAIAAGRAGSLALHANGTVTAWGNYYISFNGVLPLTVPPGLTNVVDIEFSANTAFAVLADGTAVTWGADFSGRTSVPAHATNIATISSTDNLIYSVKHDGTMIAWGGDTSYIPLYLLSQISDVVGVVAGRQHTLVLGNIPPTAQSQTLSVSYNSDRAITLTASDPNLDALQFRITALPATGTLYQFDNGTRGPAIVSTNTIVTDSSNRVLFAPATNTVGTPYTSFQFAAHDGLNSSSPATITMNVIAAAPYAHTLHVLTIRTNSATFQGMATPNGLASMAWFEWGTGNLFAYASPPQSISNGLDVIHVSADITGLTARQTAQCRLVVSNQAGIVRGMPQQFLPGGRVRAWGYGGFLQTIVPPGLTAGGISGGLYTSLAVDMRGNIITWGGLNGLATNVPPGLSNVASAHVEWDHGLAILTNGNVFVWGRNDYGQTNVPSNLSNVVRVTSMYDFSAALQADGRVRIWGNYNTANSNIITSLSNVVDMAFRYGAYFLLDDGTVRAVGDHPDPLLQMPSGLTNIVAITSLGGSLALRRDGTVVGWGGQPPVPSGLTNVIAIDAGLSHFLALREDGTVVMWGGFANGGIDISAQLTNVAAIAAGYSHNLALLPNASPAADPLTIKTPPATQIVLQLPASDPDGDILQLRVQSLPLAGNLYQYTNGTPTVLVTNSALVTDAQRRVIFVPVTNVIADPYASFTYTAYDGELETAPATVTVSIVAPIGVFTRPADEITLTSAKLNGFVSPNGFATTAWFEWGTNTSYGQTMALIDAGSGSGVVHVLQPIAGLSAGQTVHFRLVASNASQTITGTDQQFVTSGKVFAWGDNSSGQTSVPTNVGAIVSLGGGLSHSIALRTDGSVAAWGNNTHGQTNVPVSLAGVATVTAGGFHNLALLTNGNVVAWGRNNLGQANVPVSASNVVAIAAGGQHSIALRANGSLVAWGDNSQGQRNIPAPLTDAVGIASGWYHNVALRSDNTVMAWGANTYGQTNVPTGLTNAVWVGAGLYHSLALRADGTMIAWGLNSSGQTNIPAGLTNIIAVASGGSHNLAMLTNGVFAGWGYNFFGQATPPTSLSNVVNFAAGGSHSLALLPNHLPAAAGQIVAGYPNTDLLVTLNGSDADNDPLSYRISSLPTAGAVYQCSGGVRGAQIITVNSLITDPLRRIIFAPAADQAGSPHATSGFTASDSFAFSIPATVTVNIVLPSVPTLNATASTVTTNGAFQLAFTGATNAAYRVWASTNLVNWELLGTAAAPAPGQFLFLDTSATNRPQRFYRATAP